MRTIESFRHYDCARRCARPRSQTMRRRNPRRTHSLLSQLARRAADRANPKPQETCSVREPGSLRVCETHAHTHRPSLAGKRKPARSTRLVPAFYFVNLSQPVQARRPTGFSCVWRFKALSSSLFVSPFGSFSWLGAAADADAATAAYKQTLRPELFEALAQIWAPAELAHRFASNLSPRCYLAEMHTYRLETPRGLASSSQPI